MEESMKTFYRHLAWSNWHSKRQIDHHLGRLILGWYQSIAEG